VTAPDGPGARYPAAAATLNLGMRREGIVPAVTAALRAAGADWNEIAEYTRQAGTDGPVTAARRWVAITLTREPNVQPKEYDSAEVPRRSRRRTYGRPQRGAWLPPGR